MFQNSPGPFTLCTLIVDDNYPRVLMSVAGKTLKRPVYCVRRKEETKRSSVNYFTRAPKLEKNKSFL